MTEESADTGVRFARLFVEETPELTSFWKHLSAGVQDVPESSTSHPAAHDQSSRENGDSNLFGSLAANIEEERAMIGSWTSTVV